jgi:hypothetical protein
MDGAITVPAADGPAPPVDGMHPATITATSTNAHRVRTLIPSIVAGPARPRQRRGVTP